MNAPAFICTLDGPDHVYALVNERYQQLFGKRKIQDKPILVALPELEGQKFVGILDNIYKTGEIYVGVEEMIVLARDEHLAPEERYFNFSYQPMYDEDKQINAILVFGYEVTEQVNAKNKIQEIQQLHNWEMEERIQQRTLELRTANEDLVKMNKELESFTYISSHDLQEPLRKIQTFTKLIQEKEQANLSDKGKDYFQRMQNAAARMQQLITDLLAFSRLNTTERVFEKKDLQAIIAEVKNEFKEAIETQQATILVTGHCVIDVIPFQFRQLLHNLIGNALKFASRDRPLHITIKSMISKGAVLHESFPFTAEKLIPAINYCHISLADNGIGFDPEYKSRIFELFQRLNSKEEYAGTGIGLSIVKKIVENHYGLITATGELGKGAQFDIFIPVDSPKNDL